ncbi:MAG: glycosyltransferase family 2 protein, partial [Vibrionaceae bacterium]
MKPATPTISIICPCFNEQEVVEHFTQKISAILHSTGLSFELIFINDGSSDGTLERLYELVAHNSYIRVLNLSRNFGKEAALTAGLDHALGEVVIPIDADLQDPPELITQFLEKWQQGYDVVLAKRVDRSQDSWA